MHCENEFCGNSLNLQKIRSLSDSLNRETLEQINDSQELVMLNSFSQESNEYKFKKLMQDRISDVSSWIWVLQDLTMRLGEEIDALKHEHNALGVVVKRIQNELDIKSIEGPLPGALVLFSNDVEEAIIQEYKFLREQKKKFEKLIFNLENQTNSIEKTRRKIADDILNKEQAMTIDKTCATKDYRNALVGNWKKKRKKGRPVRQWIHRSEYLKRVGLKALYNAIITRQQVRESRMQLSVTAQTLATRVESVLRRRLHSNKVHLHDLNWQREEAVRDYKYLDEELISTEKSVVETVDKIRIIEARLADRTLRPGRELTKDDVNKNLKDELKQLQKFVKDLRMNMDRITFLQRKVNEAITNIDAYAEDIAQVIRLDEERIYARLNPDDTGPGPSMSSQDATSNKPIHPNVSFHLLPIIQEETEDEN